MKIITVIIFISCLFSTGNINGQSIKKYNESASNFDTSPELSSNNYPDSVLYRAYIKGGTGFKQVEGLKSKLEKRIVDFAKKNNQNFVILGQRIQNGGIGRFPKVEIIFALTDKK